jgi:hypothetical protein
MLAGCELLCLQVLLCISMHVRLVVITACLCSCGAARHLSTCSACSQVLCQCRAGARALQPEGTHLGAAGLRWLGRGGGWGGAQLLLCLKLLCDSIADTGCVGPNTSV